MFCFNQHLLEPLYILGMEHHLTATQHYNAGTKSRLKNGGFKWFIEIAQGFMPSDWPSVSTMCLFPRPLASSTITGFPPRLSSLTSWRHILLSEWRVTGSTVQSLRYYQVGEFSRDVSNRKTHCDRISENSGHISRWKQQTCVYTYVIHLPQNKTTSKVNWMLLRAGVKENQWWKLMAISKNTISHTHTCMCTHTHTHTI